MLLLITSFLAGILTVFAPCVLILLPVIVGSSLATDEDKENDRKKPYIIAISLGVSVLVFTLLLKASTTLIGIDPLVWKSISGGIVIVLGLSLLFPFTWARLSAKFGLEHGSNSLLNKASKKSGIGGYILTGAALGPVFSACSPVYVLILATVLPINFALGFVYMTLYATGLTLALLAIALVGRKLTKRLNWTAKPNGWFRRSLAILLIVVGLAVITGVDKTVQTWILTNSPINSTKLEEKLLPSKTTNTQSNNGASETMFNISPYAAPELRDIANWINSDPQTLVSLRGKVVLIDFWTYSCINCIRTQPYLNKWYDAYEKDGFVIIGVHAPEFAFEKISANVRDAVNIADIKYPVALDNNFSTWKAYDNQFWPAKYIIDKNGQVRYTHFGEGKYDETEDVIQKLLKEKGANISESVKKNNEQSTARRDQTPETYLGYGRAERFANTSGFIKDLSKNYQVVNDLASNQWSFGGDWQVKSSESVSAKDKSILRLKFSAKEVYLVMSGNGNPATLTLNGKAVTAGNQGGSDIDANGNAYPSEARLYKLINAKEFIKDGLLEIALPLGTTVNAFTFGA